MSDWLEELGCVRSRHVREGLSDGATESFQSLVWQYYRQHERKFPWRETYDPYAILVSEIMLQQTQAPRVVPKYQAFLSRFPTVQRLAEAPVADVLALWQGLGYNRRALNLQRAAHFAAEQWNGAFPPTPDELRPLPGVGPYTAAAVAAFAFGYPSAVLETNIRRLYIHAFFHEQAVVHDRELTSLVEATMPRDQVREWYYALMDFGHDLAAMLPNPNRRSSHYAKQSLFEGSNRQLRGRLLRLLLEQGSQALSGLAERLDTTAAKLEVILVQLQGEGFIAVDGDEIAIIK